MNQIKSVNMGKARHLRAEGKHFMSAIDKRSSNESIAVRKFGLNGDEQVETPRHGGVKKGVYACPVDHYSIWESAGRNHRVSLFDEPSPLGFKSENLTISGVNENAI
jgi:MOSC domain-containing protein YiiM